MKISWNMFTSDERLERGIDTCVNQVNEVIYQLSLNLKHPAIQKKTTTRKANYKFHLYTHIMLPVSGMNINQEHEMKILLRLVHVWWILAGILFVTTLNRQYQDQPYFVITYDMRGKVKC